MFMMRSFFIFYLAGPPMHAPPPNQGHPSGLPPHSNSVPPAPHVNPAFFPPHSAPPPAVAAAAPPHQSPYGGPPPPAAAVGVVAPHPASAAPVVAAAPGAAAYGPDGRRLDVPPQQPAISDSDFEDTMNRNRTVSSSAIARAVADASSGELSQLHLLH